MVIDTFLDAFKSLLSFTFNLSKHDVSLNDDVSFESKFILQNGLLDVPLDVFLFNRSTKFLPQDTSVKLQL